MPSRKQLKSSGKREISTTMAFVRLLSNLVKDKAIGERVVPIVPDEARTFGMEGMFRQLGIYSSVGQRYTPTMPARSCSTRKTSTGRSSKRASTRRVRFSAWLAAATSYSTSSYPMVPFYIYYSMFGFQRIGDLAWAAGDSQARGFLIGGHRRPHHAQWRGPAAPGRPQSPAGEHHPQLCELRPRLRLRTGGDHPGRAASACTPRAKTSSITSRP